MHNARRLVRRALCTRRTRNSALARVHNSALASPDLRRFVTAPAAARNGRTSVFNNPLNEMFTPAVSV
jgi:hypothetical protein